MNPPIPAVLLVSNRRGGGGLDFSDAAAPCQGMAGYR
jgi:hypothetical protein